MAGDDRQLPPTNFFRQVGDGRADADDDDGPDDEDSLVSLRSGFESILDMLRPLLSTSRSPGTTGAGTSGWWPSPTHGSMTAR